MFLLPFGLYCSACFGSLFVSMFRYALKFVVNKERMLVVKIVLYKHSPAVKSQSHDYRPMQIPVL